MSELYLAILDTERKEIFSKLSNFKDKGYLAGGTALALQMGHRKSFDFDVFLPKLISRQFVKKVISVFGKDIEIRISTGDLLLVKTKNGVEVHFVYFWYKNLFPEVRTGYIDLSSVRDIAANKAFTIGKRGAWRDYVDIFFLINRGIVDLHTVVDLASQKFKPEFNPRLFLEQLTYFGDIEDYHTVFLKESYSEKEIKSFLESEVRKVGLNL